MQGEDRGREGWKERRSDGSSPSSQGIDGRPGNAAQAARWTGVRGG